MEENNDLKLDEGIVTFGNKEEFLVFCFVMKIAGGMIPEGNWEKHEENSCVNLKFPYVSDVSSWKGGIIKIRSFRTWLDLLGSDYDKGLTECEKAALLSLFEKTTDAVKKYIDSGDVRVTSLILTAGEDGILNKFSVECD